MTVNGKTHRQNTDQLTIWNQEVIRTVEQAYAPEGSIAVLHGNLAPKGCVVKQSAVASDEKHTGPARCYECEEDAVKAIYGGSIQDGDVIVIRNEGPKGGPGMREMLTATAALVGMGYSEKSCSDYRRPFLRSDTGTVYRTYFTGDIAKRTNCGADGRRQNNHRYRRRQPVCRRTVRRRSEKKAGPASGISI